MKRLMLTAAMAAMLAGGAFAQTATQGTGPTPMGAPPVNPNAAVQPSPMTGDSNTATPADATSQAPAANDTTGTAAPATNDATSAPTNAQGAMNNQGAMNGQGSMNTQGAMNTQTAAPSATDTTADASATIGPPPATYPICHKHGQDRCRLAHNPR